MEEAVRRTPLVAACLMTVACLAAGALAEVTLGRMPVFRWVLYPPVPSGTPGLGWGVVVGVPAGVTGGGHPARRVPAAAR